MLPTRSAPQLCSSHDVWWPCDLVVHTRSRYDINRFIELGPLLADSDEAGHLFRSEGGHLFRREAGRDFETKPDKIPIGCRTPWSFALHGHRDLGARLGRDGCGDGAGVVRCRICHARQDLRTRSTWTHYRNNLDCGVRFNAGGRLYRRCWTQALADAALASSGRGST
jgi:hypothetical protein